MPTLLAHFVETQPQCPYQTGRECTMESRIMTGVDPEAFQALLTRGWRRFGPDYFRPVCMDCSACESIRIPVAEFALSRGHRRALRKIAGFRVEVGKPVFDRARLALHRRWYEQRRQAKGWEKSRIGPLAYKAVFAFPEPSAGEIAYYAEDKLAAIALTDFTPDALSAVYFFYDPQHARLSPGIANILLHIELARRTGRPHVYLGYYVAGCPSMAYKARFFPHERLVGRPAEGEEPVWLRYDSR